MEETLGKRIVANRKRLGMTQDALAEQLGVTAQAVSKWENDQSCPDITMLPKLARIFSTTTDELLGLTPPPASEETEVPELPAMAAAPEPDPSGEGEEGKREFYWDGRRKASLALALWVLLVGGILFIVNVPSLQGSFWDILWPSALLLFGLFGLYPRFSAARLGCALIGLYSLVNSITVLPVRLNDELVFPASLLVLGVGLLIDALRKPGKGSFGLGHNGGHIHSSEAEFCGMEGNYCNYHGESFECAAGFGEQRYLIQLPRLSGGKAELGFGEMTVDLSGCEEIAEGCLLQLKSGFGELELLVPRKWKVLPHSSASFGGVDIQGCPDPAAEAVIRAYCSASFGSITIRYI